MNPPAPEARQETEGKFFTFFVDGQEFRTDKDTLTGLEIMEIAGVTREQGLILVLDDGTERPFGEDETIELKPGRRFKIAPRFKRG